MGNFYVTLLLRKLYFLFSQLITDLFALLQFYSSSL